MKVRILRGQLELHRSRPSWVSSWVTPVSDGPSGLDCRGKPPTRRRSRMPIPRCVMPLSSVRGLCPGLRGLVQRSVPQVTGEKDPATRAAVAGSGVRDAALLLPGGHDGAALEIRDPSLWIHPVDRAASDVIEQVYAFPLAAAVCDDR